MTSKKLYKKPELSRIKLDNTISLVMMSGPIDPPPPPGVGKKGNNNNDPFKSPFGEKPFG
jgi:hypothetical protein